MAKTLSTPAPVSFEEQVRQALAHYHDPQWLSDHSPLAAPYWAGTPPAGTESGAWLRHLLYRTAATLWDGDIPAERESILATVQAERAHQGKGNRYLFLLLELHYFQHYFQIPKQSFIWEDYLFIGKSQYYRDLDSAVRVLGEHLLEQLHPSFRPEYPTPPRPFIGRQGLLVAAHDALNTGQDVALSGASGVGKSALGMAVAAAWTAGSTFWFTVRPNFTDHVQAVLLALGYFLHEQGSSALWRQVIAGNGQIENLNLALGLIHHDLAQLQPRRLLLCFDGIDHLQPTDFTETTTHYAKILELIRGIRGHASLLFLGQRAIAEADVYLMVEGLTYEETLAWLHHAAITADPADAALLHRYTGGSPRLLRLCMALTRNGDTLGQVLAQLPSVPVLQTIFQRLWQGFTAEEQALVQQLSVFPHDAPADGFTPFPLALPHLLQLGVVETSGGGRVSLVPIIRDVVYGNLAHETREGLHLYAAEVHMVRGQYTDAAYHYYYAGDAARAVHLWYDHRDIEILSGRAADALILFNTFTAHSLAEPTQQKLALIRGELHRFAGEPQAAVEALHQTAWSLESDLTPEAALLEGKLQQGLGDSNEALDIYSNGLEATTRLLRQRVSLYVQRGIVHVRQKEVQAAWREANIARYEAEHLQGVVQEAMGNYTTARSHFRVALTLAEEAQYDQGAARTHYQLGVLAGRQQDGERAVYHLNHAMQHYETIGDSFTLECVRVGLAAVKIHAHDYADAIALTRTAVAFFEGIRHPYWLRIAALNLADACYQNGQWEEAEHAALLVQRWNEGKVNANALTILGHVQRERGATTAASATYQQAIAVAAANEDVYIQAYAWQGLGKVYLQMGNLPAAQGAFHKAADHFQHLQMPVELAESQTLLAMSQEV